jgi:4-hydroxybenzoate polyprenyltransferase
MGMNRVADAHLDAANPRTADRAIPAGRLRRRTALALTLASGALFIACAWGFYPMRGNPWPGILAPPVLAVLYGYAYTKRFTALSHWVLGLALGLAPVGAWIALRGEVGLFPVLVGGAVLFWTAGFDILYAMQDETFDRAAGLKSIPALVGRPRAARLALGSHILALALLAGALAAVPECGVRSAERGVNGAPEALSKSPRVPVGQSGIRNPESGVRNPEGGKAGPPWRSTPGGLAALAVVAVLVAVQHLRARRGSAEKIGAAFFPLNAAVSIVWMAGAILDALRHVPR